MTDFDDIFLPTALNLVTEFGRDMDFVEVTAGAFDPLTQKKTPTEVVHTRISSPPLELEELGPGIKYLSAAIVAKADKFIIVAGSGLPFTPVLNMAVQYSGRKTRVVGLNEMWSGDSIAAYILFLSRTEVA